MEELRVDRRRRLGDARLMLLFTPEVCPAGKDPLAILAGLVPHVDVIQVRVKGEELGRGQGNNKKRAEQAAAQDALSRLGLLEEPSA